MFDGPRMLVAAALVASTATFLPMSGAAAAEPLPAGEYTAPVDAVGDVVFEVFPDGSVETVDVPEDTSVYFRFDEEIRVLDEFHVVADTNYLVEVDVDEEDGTYEVKVSEDPDWVPHTVLLAGDEDDAGEDGEDGEDGSGGVAANKSEDAAPGQHGRDNADEKAGEHGAEGRANADEMAGQGNRPTDDDEGDEQLEGVTDDVTGVADDAPGKPADAGNAGAGRGNGRG